MASETYLHWTFRRIENIADHTTQKGCRMRDLRTWFMMAHVGQPTRDLDDAIEEAIRGRRLVAVRIKYGPNYDGRKRVIVAAHAVSFVAGDDAMVYIASRVPNTVKLHVARAAKRTLAALAAQ